MNQFSIKDIENLTGIKAHTWRIWEQRYNIGAAKRKDSNHRFYDNENLKEILRIAWLYHSGVKISKIAALDNEEMKKQALEKLPKENGNEFYIKELLEASIDLDEERFERSFDEAMKRMGTEETILNVLYPFQDKIGVLWLTDHVIPSQEHFTSNIIRQKLTIAIDKLPYVKESEKKVIVLFTPEREQHEIPLQFIHYLLKKNKNKIIYFGSNVSLDSIECYMERCSFDYMFFHLITNLTSLHPDEYLANMSKRFSNKKIIMAGTQVQNVTKVPGNVRLLQSMDEIIEFTNE